MINEENLTEMYDTVIKGETLTTKNLMRCGFNFYDITKLIDGKHVLKKVGRGHHELHSIDELFCYGKRLMLQGEIEKAKSCFLKCYDLDSQNLEVCRYLFLILIKEENYKEAFLYFDCLYNTNIQDCNFYLYLLNRITKVPEKHREYAKFLNFDDVKIIDGEDADIQNEIRSMVVTKQLFSRSIKLLNGLNNDQEQVFINNMITKTLLSQAANVQKVESEKLKNLFLDCQYQEMIDLLKAKDYRLRIYDEYLLKLVESLQQIIEKKEFPQIKIHKTNNVFKAIDGFHYSLALSLCKESNKKNGIDKENSLLYLLLEQINNWIDIIKGKTIAESDHQIANEKPKDIQDKTLASSLEHGGTITQFISALMKQNLDYAFQILREYLISIDRKEFEFLIVDLVKISIFSKDQTFSKPMSALIYLSHDHFQFDISKYIQSFYETLVQNKFDETRLYLDIISKSNELGQTCTLTDELKQILDNTEKIVREKNLESQTGGIFQYRK